MESAFPARTGGKNHVRTQHPGGIREFLRAGQRRLAQGARQCPVGIGQGPTSGLFGRGFRSILPAFALLAANVPGRRSWQRRAFTVHGKRRIRGNTDTLRTVFRRLHETPALSAGPVGLCRDGHGVSALPPSPSRTARPDGHAAGTARTAPSRTSRTAGVFVLTPAAAPKGREPPAFSITFPLATSDPRRTAAPSPVA